MRREPQDRYEVESKLVRFPDGDVTVHIVTDRRTGQHMFISGKGGSVLDQDEAHTVFQTYYRSRERREDDRRRGRRLRVRKRKIK